MRDADSFWAKAVKSPSCLLWTGSFKEKGYAQVHWRGEMRRAHRVAYELAVGPIPEGMDLHHTCRVKACINPEHLQLVTDEEHRQMHAKGPKRVRVPRVPRTHCAIGHELTPENTYTVIPRRGKSWRDCLICRRSKAKAYKQRRRAA